MGLFTRFDYAEIKAASPSQDDQNALRQSDDPRDQALWLAICSLQRIAGADSPEGGAPEVDALRNLNRVSILLDER